jgi:hypothetical protein
MDLFHVPLCYQDQIQEHPETFPIQDIRAHGYERSTLGYYLKYDDFDGLQALSTHPTFNCEGVLTISPCDLPLWDHLPNESLLSVSAFYGSLKCFKFLLLNESKVSSSVCESSVKGGHIEIVRICEHQHGDFTHSLSSAISYLRHDIANWLMMNFTVNGFTFKECIQSNNFVAIFYLLANRTDINAPLVFYSYI